MKRYGRTKKGKGSDIRTILNENTNFLVAEAYKTIRTNLLFTASNKGCRRIMIASAEPNEGKSTSCCNIGITIAQMNANVLIVDCDLRKPDIHKYFGIKGIPGLSEVLAGMSRIEDVIHTTDYPNLKVICGGSIPPNPAELLGGAAMDALLNKLSNEYDYILFDTPPINAVSDALVLSSMTEGAVFVVRQGRSTHPEFRRAVSRLKFAEIKILGVILNDIEKKRNNFKKYQTYAGYYTSVENLRL